MRLLKQLFIGIIGLSLLMFLFSLLLPTQIRISRGIVIAKPIDSIAVYIGNVRLWHDWNPLVQADDEAGFVYKGDSILEWTSSLNKPTKNRIGISPRRDTLIPVTMDLYGQKTLESGFNLTQHEGMGGNGTQVEWWIIERTGWLPWNKFYGIFADKMKGPVMEKGLSQLKEKIEK